MTIAKRKTRCQKKIDKDDAERLDEVKGSAEKPKEAKEDVEVRVGRKRPRLTMQLYNVIANRSGDVPRPSRQQLGFCNAVRLQYELLPKRCSAKFRGFDERFPPCLSLRW